MSAWVVPSHVDRRSVVDFDLFSDRRFAAAGTPQGALRLLADEVGLGKTIDPSQMEIVISKKGYVLAAPVRLPNKAEGGVGPIEFILKPVDALPSTN